MAHGGIDGGLSLIHDDDMRTATLHELGDMKVLTEPLLITKAGKPIGVFHPLPDPDASISIEERRRLAQETGSAITSHLRARGISEEDVERDIDALRSDRG